MTLQLWSNHPSMYLWVPMDDWAGGVILEISAWIESDYILEIAKAKSQKVTLLVRLWADYRRTGLSWRASLALFDAVLCLWSPGINYGIILRALSPNTWLFFIIIQLGRRQWHPIPVLVPGESHGWRSLVGCSHGVAKSRTRLSDFTLTFHFHALEKEMATHSSVLAWRIPGMGEPGGLPSLGSHRVGHNWSNLAVAGAPCIYCLFGLILSLSRTHLRLFHVV